MPITSATGLSSGADKNAKNMGVPKIRPNPKPIPGQLQARPNLNQNNPNPNLILTLARPGFRLWAGLYFRRATETLQCSRYVSLSTKHECITVNTDIRIVNAVTSAILSSTDNSHTTVQTVDQWAHSQPKVLSNAAKKSCQQQLPWQPGSSSCTYTADVGCE